MAGTSLTVTYTPSAAIDGAKLYLTQGNSTTLVLDAQAMTPGSSDWTYTANHASFTAGAKISLLVVQSQGGVDTCMPQGTREDKGSWYSVTYGSGTTENVTVTYDSQDATVAASPASQTVAKGATVGTLPTDPSKTGSTFSGWFPAVEGEGGAAFTAATPVDADRTVYAYWTAAGSDSIEYSGSYGAISVSGMSGTSVTVTWTPAAAATWARLFLSQGNGGGLVLASQDMAFAAGEWSYTFSHASYTPGAKISLCVLALVSGAVIVAPQGTLGSVPSWASFDYLSPATATVTYDSQGATLPANPASQVVKAGNAVGTLPRAPQLDGFAFVGWYTQPAGAGTEFTATTAVGGSLTVYARWVTAITHDVTFDADGGTFSGGASTEVLQVLEGFAITDAPMPTRADYYLYGWYSGRNGAGSPLDANSPVTCPRTFYAFWKSSASYVDLGPNVIIIDPSMSTAEIEAITNGIYKGTHQMESGQFSAERFAILFKPGSYSANIYAGYYTHVAGLGRHPDDVHITGTVQADGQFFRPYSTHGAPDVLQNFWRMIENFSVTPTTTINYHPGTMLWGVSQAAPMRRVHVKGSLDLWDSDGWASGGFMGDCYVDGVVRSGAQQQWLYRNNGWGELPIGGVWNMVFVGNSSAPASAWPTDPNTSHYVSVASTPTAMREKPYLYLTEAGDYAVFVPSLRAAGSSGPSWTKTGGQTAGTSLPIASFYVAKPGVTAATLNAQLAAGKNLLFTPGIYQLNATLHVDNPNTVVLGIGLATLVNATGLPAMEVGDADGVILAGLLFDAGAAMAGHQLVVGHTTAGHASNPIFLFDLLFRVGGAQAGSVGTSLQIKASDVVGDNFWIWRADHGYGVGWDVNRADTGLVVDGADVTIYGLAVEHYQKYQTIWNGEGGKVYFYQSECPYDVPDQASWMNGTTLGYASYKVTAAAHSAFGVGVYIYFNVDRTIVVERAIEVPDGCDEGEMFRYICTVGLSSDTVNDPVGTVNHVINLRGTAAISVDTSCFLIE